MDQYGSAADFRWTTILFKSPFFHLCGPFSSNHKQSLIYEADSFLLTSNLEPHIAPLNSPDTEKLLSSPSWIIKMVQRQRINYPTGTSKVHLYYLEDSSFKENNQKGWSLHARRLNKHWRDKLWTLNVKLHVLSEAKADVQTTYPAAYLKINKNHFLRPPALWIIVELNRLRVSYHCRAFSFSCMLFKSFCIPWL